MLKTLKYKLLIAFLTFSIIVISITVLSYFYFSEKKRMDNLIDELLLIQIMILEDSKLIDDFFTYDTKNPDFFQNQNASYLNMHDSLFSEIVLHIKELGKTDNLLNLSKVHLLLYALNDYNEQFRELVDLIHERGFKDNGVEGDMRKNIHQIEKTKNINLASVLMLRRHEKDYIIRHEKKYIEKLKKTAENFKTEIIYSKLLSADEKSKALDYLGEYKRLFLKMVNLDYRIGIKDNSSLKKKSDLTRKNTIKQFQEIIDTVKNKSYKKEKRLKIQFISISVLLILLSIFAGVYFANRLSYRLSILSANISSFINNGFNDFTPMEIDKSSDEIGMLISNYRLMKEEIISLVKSFQQKVEERTAEIQAQKDKIQQQNLDIIDSIHYAKRIQEALLPSKIEFEKVFPRNFILYKPKDIVSGDFYWVKRFKKATIDFKIIVVADCTGHGIPGAFMSVLGIAYLNEIVYPKKIKSAADILNLLKKNIIESLKHNDDGHLAPDGMDMGICIINYNNHKMQFAGANHHLYHIQNQHLTKIKGDRMPVGKYICNDKRFTNNEIDFQLSDKIYLFSDGYADQFGGKANRKFMTRKLENLIQEVNESSLSEQKEILNKRFEQWRKDNKQTDDVLIVGIEL